MSGPRKTQALRFDAPWLGQRLRALLSDAPVPTGICVAWSGGADSTALLAALAELRDQPAPGGPWPYALRAIHVDHHLQAASAEFRKHCRRLSRQLGVPLQVRDARIRLAAGASVEEAARDARYGLLARALRPGEVLLTAQHAHDQLETVLLQLLRGGGVAGIAGMPERAAFGSGTLLRPLLGVPGDALRAYVVSRDIPWLEDPSNADTRFDRNYLRAEILPRLLARWPAAARTVARSARHAAEADAIARRTARLDAAAAAYGQELELAVLRRLGPARQRAALRYWIEGRGFAPPDARRLAEVQGLLALREDAKPLVHWSGVEVRRHEGVLHVRAAEPVTAADRQVPAAGILWRWQRQRRVKLPGGCGHLELRRDPWGDVACALLPAVLELRFRAGGERFMTAIGHRDVKSLLREAGVPAWERARVPLIYGAKRSGRASAPRLLAIGDLWTSDAVRPSTPAGERARFVWQQE